MLSYWIEQVDEQIIEQLYKTMANSFIKPWRTEKQSLYWWEGDWKDDEKTVKNMEAILFILGIGFTLRTNHPLPRPPKLLV